MYRFFEAAQNVFLAACVAGIVVGFLYIVYASYSQLDRRKDKHHEACVDVLRCIDLGVERSKCAELFTACDLEASTSTGGGSPP